MFDWIWFPEFITIGIVRIVTYFREKKYKINQWYWLTSVSSKTGLSLASILLSVFELGFTLPASIHNFFQSLSVKIDLLSATKERVWGKCKIRIRSNKIKYWNQYKIHFRLPYIIYVCSPQNCIRFVYEKWFKNFPGIIIYHIYSYCTSKHKYFDRGSPYRYIYSV